jgi:hypothetical protein
LAQLDENQLMELIGIGGGAVKEIKDLLQRIAADVTTG